MGSSIDQGQTDAPTLWHLSWQAAAGREVFVHPSLYGRVRERLIDAHRRRGRVLVDYQLLPTEIHVVSEIPPGDSVGGVARAIANVVARWVRELQPVRSPVFAGRYRAHRIGSDSELRHEARMLAWRPVFLGICATPTHHANGALRIVLGLTPAKGFDARPLLRLFGEGVQSARAAMRAWVAKRPSERDARQWELTRGLALATLGVGSRPVMTREIRDAVAAAFVAVGRSGDIAGALELLERWVMAKLGEHPGPDARGAASGASARGRALVACLAVQHGLCSAASVARHFGRSKATLSEQMTACRARPADRLLLRTPPQRILDEAVALARAAARRRRSGGEG